VIYGVSEFIGRKAPVIRLADITSKAAELLSADGKSFFLMVEGGAIDHRNHRNNYAGAIREMIEFDAAIGEALKFAEKHPEETLIVVTADHDTGGTIIKDLSKNKKDFYLGQKKSFGELGQMVEKMKKAKAVWKSRTLECINYQIQSIHILHSYIVEAKKFQQMKSFRVQ
jgi:alkaline phosphatase